MAIKIERAPYRAQTESRPCSKCGIDFTPTLSQWATYNWQCPDCSRKRRRELRRLRREGGSR